MIRKYIITAVSAAVLALSLAASAQQGGTAAEAKAMLLKAVAAVKADKAKALDMFNKGEGGFLVGDLYVFCANASDGKIVALANPNAKQLIGQDQRTLKDPTGKPFGQELYAAAQKPEGQITEVSYMFPRPGSDPKPVPKVSLVARVDDLGCGVGYYKLIVLGCRAWQSLRGGAAVDDEAGAGHKSGIVGSEKDDAFGDVGRCGQAADRQRLQSDLGESGCAVGRLTPLRV